MGSKFNIERNSCVIHHHNFITNYLDTCIAFVDECYYNFYKFQRQWIQTAPDRWRLLRAHGLSVGLPSDEDMGNSEVGHNALGAGRIFEQGYVLVSQHKGIRIR
jgi:hypothetical protein